MLEICRAHPPSLHLGAHPQVRDNSRGERVPSEPLQLRVGGLDQALVHRMGLRLHRTVLHRDSRSHLRRKVHCYSRASAVRFPAFLRSELILQAVSDRSGFEAVLSAEPPPKVWAAESLDEDGELETGSSAAAALV